jgi:hypothetical protein
MRYRSDYQETHDIDWFFRYQGHIYHAASNGGILPDAIDSEENRIVQEKLEDIVGRFPVIYAQDLNPDSIQDEDLSTFAEYASKGFISLDRTETTAEEEENIEEVPRYHVVALPGNNGHFDNQELMRLIPELGAGDIIIE